MDPAQRFATPVTGPSYRWSAKALAAVVLAWLAAYGARTVATGGFGLSGWLVVLAGMTAVVVTGWSVFAGRTTIDAQGIHQSGLPRRALRWHEIARARRLRMPLTTRLVVSTGTGPLRAIHAGNRALEDAFGEIDTWYNRRT